MCVCERVLASLEGESMPNVGEELPIQRGQWPASARVRFSEKISSSLRPNSSGHTLHLVPRQRWEVSKYKYSITVLKLNVQVLGLRN